MPDVMDDENPQRDQLADLIASVAPPTTRPSPALQAAIAESTARTIRPTRGRRRVPILAAILAPALVLGGTGAAFAAVGVNWSPFWNNSPTWTGWATHPDAEIRYRLPGGGSCTMRFGALAVPPASSLPSGVPAADPSAAQVTIAYLKSGTVPRDARIQEVLIENRSDENLMTDPNGNSVPFGYGTSNYIADVEYQIAVKEAIQEAIAQHLKDVGVPSTGVGYQSQEQCSGMQQ
jgi:hypothetical protein